ncbi:pyridoxal 5'-phosphate synthase glutaminase subunit PdxT [Microbacterium sp. A93]|uniref:pyridoxal 5'-phosphate synthase glutaminase subunit PdxT n=1 Tax=Microbacterium sp. A93 TaxID=3450716 RepID=UPI003F4226F0
MTSRPAGPLVGVFALQGDVAEHELVLTALGARVRMVRSAADLAGLDGLVLPGGESSVMDKLSRLLGVAPAIRQAIAAGLPVYGTCAGMIMLADQIANPIGGQHGFGGLDITVQRNAFGAQVDSFETWLEVPEVSGEPVHAVFIRAPAVLRAGGDVHVLASVPASCLESPDLESPELRAALTGPDAGPEAALDVGPDVGPEAAPDGGGLPVAVRQGHLLATSFHPEVTGDWSFHRYFLESLIH